MRVDFKDDTNFLLHIRDYDRVEITFRGKLSADILDLPKFTTINNEIERRKFIDWLKVQRRIQVIRESDRFQTEDL